MNEKDKAINDLAEQFQNDCHKVVETILPKKPILNYDDAIHIWLYRKLAELQLEINELKNK